MIINFISRYGSGGGGGGGGGSVCDNVRFYPRSGLANRINGGKIYGSNTSFTAGLVELATISGCVDGAYTTISFSNSTVYQYLVIGSGGTANCPEAAEIDFRAGTTSFTALEIQASAEFGGGYTKENAFDGNTATEYAGIGGSSGWIGIRVS